MACLIRNRGKIVALQLSIKRDMAFNKNWLETVGKKGGKEITLKS